MSQPSGPNIAAVPSIADALRQRRGLIEALNETVDVLAERDANGNDNVTLVTVFMALKYFRSRDLVFPRLVAIDVAGCSFEQGPWRFELWGQAAQCRLSLHLADVLIPIEMRATFHVITMIGKYDDGKQRKPRETLIRCIERNLGDFHARQQLLVMRLIEELKVRLDHRRPFDIEGLIIRYHLQPTPLANDPR